MKQSIYLLIEDYHMNGEHFDSKVNVYQSRESVNKAFSSRRDDLKSIYEKKYPNMVGDSQTEEGAKKPYQFDEYQGDNSDKLPRFDIWQAKDPTYEFNALRIVRKRIQVREENKETENNKQ